MDAKDAIIEGSQFLKIAHEGGLDVAAKAQAEVAFKAGRMEGIKEVVKFIDWLDNGTRSSGNWRFEVRKFRQAKLKEWEVE